MINELKRYCMSQAEKGTDVAKTAPEKTVKVLDITLIY